MKFGFNLAKQFWKCLKIMVMYAYNYPPGRCKQPSRVRIFILTVTKMYDVCLAYVYC